jgi:hypothetical protein
MRTVFSPRDDSGKNVSIPDNADLFFADFDGAVKMRKLFLLVLAFRF